MYIWRQTDRPVDTRHALLNKLKQYSSMDKIWLCSLLFSLLVVHCPALKPPENGFFIQNTCRNHFNAACGVRCRPGFDLVGSSIHLCQPNGLWSGTESFCRGMQSGQVLSFLGCLARLSQFRVSNGPVSYLLICLRKWKLEDGWELLSLPDLIIANYAIHIPLINKQRKGLSRVVVLNPPNATTP